MLSLDPATIIFQVINFLVLAFVLNRWVFQPVLRQSERRAKEREQLMSELTSERQKLAEARAELEKKTESLEEESDSILADVRRQAVVDQQELLSEARAEAEIMLREAQSDAQRLRRQSLEQHLGQLVDTVLQVSGNVMAKVTPVEVHDRLVQRLSERIREMGRTEMPRIEALRRSLGGREATAFVASARELSAEQQALLARILTALADHRVNIELSVEPELVAGVRVRLGDTVMDSSLAAQLADMRGTVAGTLNENIGND
jgi:F-type H+-transporting ATPase subunit b